MVQGRPRHAGDLGNGALGDAETQEMADFMFLAVEARDTERSFGPSKLLTGRPGFDETFAGALRDQIAFDLGEQGKERGHDLAPYVLLALDVDLFLDGNEGDAFPGQRIKHGDDLTQRAAEPGKFTDDEPIAGLEGAHQVVEAAALGRSARPRRWLR